MKAHTAETGIDMQNWSFGMLLIIALVGGIRHAFDADHVMTLTGFNQQFSQDDSGKTSRFFAFCLHWSMGHGGILLIVGALVLLMGMAIPDHLSRYAETACALLLILLGLALLFGFLGNNLHSQQQAGQAHANPYPRRLLSTGRYLLLTYPRQSAVGIGLLHGLSGSASILALLPIMNIQSAWQGMLYLICFGAGVTLGMLFFAASLNYGYQRWLQNPKFAQRFRSAIGIFSIIYGIFMLLVLS